jgi:hypothetical protein
MDSLLEVAKVVEGIYTHRDLLDPMRVLKGGPAVDQGDLVVDAFRVGAEKGPQRTDLGQSHAHEIRVEILHEFQVMNVEAYMTESIDFR